MSLQIEFFAQHEPGQDIQNGADDELVDKEAGKEQMCRLDGAVQNRGGEQRRDKLHGSRKAEERDDLQNGLDDEVEHDGQQRLVRCKAEKHYKIIEQQTTSTEDVILEKEN